MPIISTDDANVELVTFEVEDAGGQRCLLDALTEQVNGWVRTIPGFVSASFHLSHDGKKLFNYAQWQSRAAWETFGADARREHIRAAVNAAGALHTGGQGYRVAQIVEPDA